MQFPDEVVDDVQRRLRRIEGELRTLQRLLADGEECRDVVAQLADVRAALDHTAYRLLASTLRQCIAEPEQAEAAGLDADAVEKLFLKLA
ncbi:hypothetical protein BH24ACT3_BH24ACT3_18950 [soil metagenome]